MINSFVFTVFQSECNNNASLERKVKEGAKLRKAGRERRREVRKKRR